MKGSATEGSGSVITPVAPATACAYLADPRHAAEWFARVAVDGLLERAPREGQRWRFMEGGRASARTIELVRLDCPRGFVWQTRLAAPRTNIRWEMAIAVAAGGGSTLRLTTRWLPGPFGWPLVLLLALVRRDALGHRAQRTVERARDALDSAFPPAPGRSDAPMRPAPPAKPRRRARRR